MKELNPRALRSLREKYPCGCAVELVSMNDPYRKMPSGMKGIVFDVDDCGTVFVHWENGSSLGAVYGEDVIRRID